jgi:hypothetical protein
VTAALVLLRSAEDDADVVIARRARLRERLATRMHATKLDSELAAGVAPASRAALALRAQALGETGARMMLGQQIRRILSDARGPRRVTGAQVPVRLA